MKLFTNNQRAAQGVAHHARTWLHPLFALSMGVFFLTPLDGVAKEPIPLEKKETETFDWLELSLGLRETYDSNIYATGAGRDRFPATVPQGLIALKDKGSLVTTISPSVGVDISSLLGNPEELKTFKLTYAPDFVRYHNAPSENFLAHRILTDVKAKSGPVSFKLTNTFSAIDGSNEGLIYPGGNSSFANGIVRERRNQWQDRGKASVTVDLGPVFVRPAVSIQYYDLAVQLRKVSGYTNYIDRYDFNGGADFGYKVREDLAVTVGYRQGYQYQQQAWLEDYNASNNYQRVLIGLEGTPVKGLKLEAVIGPEWKTYGKNRPLRGDKTGIIERESTDYYAEAGATLTPWDGGTLSLKYKHWNWLSSTGRNATREDQFEAGLRQALTKKLKLDLSFRIAQADYNPSAYRNDLDYTANVGLSYVLNKHVTLDAGYTYDRARNDQFYGIPLTQERSFTRHLITGGATLKF